MSINVNSLCFKTSIVAYEIGTSDFLNAFFSTIFYHLEKGKMGKRFPRTAKLYWGEIDSKEIPGLKKEVQTIRKKLEKFSPHQIIWDLEDLGEQPPWGNNIAEDIDSLANYFVTAAGRDLFDVLNRSIETALEARDGIKIERLVD